MTPRLTRALADVKQSQSMLFFLSKARPMHALCMRYACAMHAPCMRYACAMHAPCPTPTSPLLGLLLLRKLQEGDRRHARQRQPDHAAPRD
eukprot:scaffold35287_cov63-Phaeocystis_antarctica.AAC.2